MVELREDVLEKDTCGEGEKRRGEDGEKIKRKKNRRKRRRDIVKGERQGAKEQLKGLMLSGERTQ